MENTLEVRSMTWSEYEQFIDEVEPSKPTFDGKTQNEETIKALSAYQRRAAKWVMDNIYSGFDINQFTPMEVLGIFSATMKCTHAVREDEIKNLKSSLLGSTKEPNTVKAAPRLIPRRGKR